jgi:phage terminase large subunit-like protein
MDDFKKLQDAKVQCLTDITTHLPDYANRLNQFDPRLMIYITDAISNDGSHANLYELLGIRRELRLMDSYELSTDRVHRSLRAIEGIWNRDGWQRGGLKFDTPRGNQHVRLMPYQVWCVFGIYGFLTDIDMERPYVSDIDLLPTEYRGDNGNVWDKRRLTDEADIFQTRKSGKTEFGASIDFTEVSSLGPANAQVVICANSSEQAQIAFKAVKNFAYDIDPTCLNRMGGKFFRVSEKGMKWQPGYRMKGEVRPLTAGSKASKRKDGWYAYIVHAEEHGSADYTNGQSDMQSLVEVMWGSTGPRREKLLLHTTTAGLVKDGPYKLELEQVVEPMLLKELDYPLGEPHRTDDDHRFSFLLRLDPWEITDDLDKLDDKELFKKVNRSIGTTVQPDYYRKRLRDARTKPETKKEVLTKDFNIWQSGRIEKWVTGAEMKHLQREMRIDQCTAKDGWVIFTGLDFSLGGDWSGPAWLAARKHPLGRGTEFFADADVWISEEEFETSPLHPLYEQWIEGGWMHLSPGKTFQPELFITRMDELIKKGCQFMLFGFDKYKSKVPINILKAYLQATLGIANPDAYVQVVSQLNSEFNGPTEDLYNAMFAQVPFISFSNSPLWPFCFNCAALEVDNRGNKRPVKANQSASTKVDIIQAIIMALDLYERYEGMNH